MGRSTDPFIQAIPVAFLEGKEELEALNLCLQALDGGAGLLRNGSRFAPAVLIVLFHSGH